MARSLDQIALDLKRDCIAHLNVASEDIETPSLFSPRIAYTSALLSWLTYAVFEESNYDSERDFIPSTSAGGGQRLFSTDFLDQSERQYFTVDSYYVKALGIKSPNAIFVAFRGTKSFFDWVQNSKIRKYKHREAFFHQGFTELAHSTFGAVGDGLKSLQPDRDQLPVFLCGHSLGGALARLFSAERLRWSRYNTSWVEAVYTQAAPRYGGGQLLECFNSPHHRITMPGDIVPNLPPRRLGFRHDTFPLLMNDIGSTPTGHFKRIVYSIGNSVGKYRPSRLKASHSIERYIRALQI